jgi:hypothetical protein
MVFWRRAARASKILNVRNEKEKNGFNTNISGKNGK